MSCVVYSHAPSSAPVKTIGVVVTSDPLRGLTSFLGSVFDRAGTEVHGITLTPTHDVSQLDAWFELEQWFREHVLAILQPTLDL